MSTMALAISAKAHMSAAHVKRALASGHSQNRQLMKGQPV